jgi:hypothetical protein
MKCSLGKIKSIKRNILLILACLTSWLNCRNIFTYHSGLIVAWDPLPLISFPRHKNRKLAKIIVDIANNTTSIYNIQN